ncbi:MAG TPA: SpoIIE family protein phosphatase [Bryobacteraceae bacterium]|nr:SpoIIE family protein phosphatase [Bryobacteraceae bacterium]
MSAVASKSTTRELLIHTPDGKTQTLSLSQPRYTVGRSSGNELCYPDDSGLSRQHFALEQQDGQWVVRDLGSKNGTFVNGERITAAHVLGRSDRITAGHLIVEFADRVENPLAANTVVFVERKAATPVSTTVAESLKGLEGGGHMAALINAGKELSGHKPLSELFETILKLSIDAVGAARGVLMTLENGELQLRAAKGGGLQMSSEVRDRVIEEKRSVLVRDAQLDEAFAERQSIVQQQIRSMLAVPLQTDTRVIGLIYLDSPHFVHEFTKDDLNLLTVMANIAAIRIEHARLAEVEQAEKMLASELQQAAEIQRRLLPEKAPVLPGVDIAGYNASCHTVGGDYYDFLTYPDGRVGLLVADVAGKGMPAALMVSSLQARVQVLFEEYTDLASRVTRLNRIIHTSCPNNRFITFFLGVLDPATGEMTYCNAGHNPPLLVRANGSVESLETTGLILGILPRSEIAQSTCKLERGDLMVLFSDGVTEASRADADEEFGEERLAATLRECVAEPAQGMIATVIRKLTEFTSGAPPADDITLVVVKYKGVPAG